MCITPGQSSPPDRVVTAATRALAAYGVNNPNQFTFTSDPEFIEVQANIDSDAAKDVEVDIVNDANDNRIEEVERLVALSSAPTAVRNRFSNVVPTARRSVLCVERSISPAPGPRPVPPANPSTGKHEIAYRCTSQFSYPASVSGAQLDGVDRVCRVGEVNEIEIQNDGDLIRIKEFS